MLILPCRMSLIAVCLCLLAVAAPTVRADEKADTLLREVQTATLALHSLSADVDEVEHVTQEISYMAGKNAVGKAVTSKSEAVQAAKLKTVKVPVTWHRAGKARLKRPNFAYVMLEDVPARPTVGVSTVMASDGNVLTRLFYQTYQQAPTNAQGRNIRLSSYSPIDCFFAPDQYTEKSEFPYEVRYAGEEKIDGVTYQLVEATQNAFRNLTTTLYINPQHLVTRVRHVAHGRASTFETIVSLHNISLDPTLPDGEFAYALPANTRPERRQSPADLLNALLPLGKTAPDFAFVTQTGVQRRLSDILKGKKAVLVNFWYNTCYYCRLEMPHLQELYQACKDQGFDVVAVNHQDRADIVRQFLTDNKLGFDAAMTIPGQSDNVVTSYKVTGWPTNYLLDSSGKILWRSSGFDKDAEQELRAVLKAQGLKP